MQAYVLIKIRTGEVREVVRQLRRINNITEANMTFGLYDAVAIVKVDNLNQLGQIIATQVQPIPGVSETLTCLAVELN